MRDPEKSELLVNIGQQLPGFEREKVAKSEEFTTHYYITNTQFEIKNHQPLILNKVPLKPSATVPVEIQIKLPKDPQSGEYLIHADQYLGDKHLGRVNYLLRLTKKPDKKKVKVK